MLISFFKDKFGLLHHHLVSVYTYKHVHTGEISFLWCSSSCLKVLFHPTFMSFIYVLCALED